MATRCHGSCLSLNEFERARAEISGLNARFRFPFSLLRPPDLTDYDYLFPDLQDQPEALLIESPSTVGFLTRLADTMREEGTDPALDSTIPSAYTYFGQFVDHDVTLELRSTELSDLTGAGLAPLPLATVRGELKNGRSASLDLDSLYRHPARRDGARFVVGHVSQAPPDEGIRPHGKDEENDLPRKPVSADPDEDRAAQIGDARNDANLIVAQLHVAFLRAHNALVDRGHTFARARTLLRQHYQWVVIHDYLKRVVDRAVVDRILTEGHRVYSALAEPFFLPLEFSVAAFRFGHSMVRSAYNYNLNFLPARLRQLFAFTAFAGNFQPTVGVTFPTLPEHWIIEWERFIEGGTNFGRKIDTQVVAPLFALPNSVGGPLSGGSQLTVRNLLRGYQLRMPTGQAVAQALGITSLSPQEIRETAPTFAQLEAITAGGFDTRTPLWFYILAEAARGGGNRLGPVGSALVAEVLIGLVRRSQDSILAVPGWSPSLESLAGAGRFELPDLLRLAGNLG